jgi:D-alanyl-lipoteichoic acid acyltransferase DltB (MBOAT superfamily)
MAIGMALMFGLLLPENFRRPYLSTDIREFWRRWHITLSNFIRDYLYIPLGGSRNGWRRYVCATLASMGLCGLWHGAGWTFIAWGLLHGLGLLVHRAWTMLRHPLPAPLGWGLTMLFVVAGWVLFRADSFGTAARLLGSMAGLHGLGGPLQAAPLLAVSAFVSVAIPSAYELKERWIVPSSILGAATAALAVWCLLVVGTGAPVNFIYFQF